MLPETQSFPLKLKLSASGALGDSTLPGPAVADEGEPWKIEEAEDSSEDEQVDGSLDEDRRRF